MAAGAYTNREIPSMATKRNPQQKKSRKFKSTSGSLVSALFFHAIHLLTMKYCRIQTHILYASSVIQNKVDSMKGKKIIKQNLPPKNNN